MIMFHLQETLKLWTIISSGNWYASLLLSTCMINPKTLSVLSKKICRNHGPVAPRDASMASSLGTTAMEPRLFWHIVSRGEHRPFLHASSIPGVTNQDRKYDLDVNMMFHANSLYNADFCLNIYLSDEMSDVFEIIVHLVVWDVEKCEFLSIYMKIITLSNHFRNS